MPCIEDAGDDGTWDTVPLTGSPRRSPTKELVTNLVERLLKNVLESETKETLDGLEVEGLSQRRSMREERTRLDEMMYKVEQEREQISRERDALRQLKRELEETGYGLRTHSQSGTQEEGDGASTIICTRCKHTLSLKQCIDASALRSHTPPQTPRQVQGSPQHEDKFDEVLELNVGGKIVAVRRSTLCQVPGSRLHSLFSRQDQFDAPSPHVSQDRWSGDGGRCSPLPLDAQGRAFLDVQPECFLALLTSLRHVCLAKETMAGNGPHTPVPMGPVPRDLEAYMQSLITHLGLQSLIFSAEDPASFLQKRIEVYWSRYDRYFPGTVAGYDVSSGRHEVHYDDGDVRGYDLRVQDWRFQHTYIRWLHTRERQGHDVKGSEPWAHESA